MKQLSLITIIIINISVFINAQSDNFDHSIFDKLLRENVDNDGLIDYQAFEANRLFDQYINNIATGDLTEMEKADKLAFLINAYNAMTIKNVLNNFPIDSPMDVEGFFKEKKFIVAGIELTLDELEYNHILPIEKVLPHFGLVCAAVSCPKLIREAYNGKSVLTRLEENARIFLNDKTKNYLDRESKTLYLSEIFKWFRKYFEEKYGSLLETVKQFINHDDKIFIDKNEVEIKFITYNWQLNSQ
jgi:hypothetical protein